MERRRGKFYNYIYNGINPENSNELNYHNGKIRKTIPD